MCSGTSLWPGLLRHAVAATVLSACCCARALIVGPYSLDASTLHLWHLNETAVPALDSAPGGTNLTALGGSATLGNAFDLGPPLVATGALLQLRELLNALPSRPQCDKPSLKRPPKEGRHEEIGRAPCRERV